MKNTNRFSVILNYLPFKKGMVLHLNKLAELPLPSDAKFGSNQPSSSREEDDNVKSLRCQ